MDDGLLCKFINQVICVLCTYFTALKMSVSCSFSSLAWIARGCHLVCLAYLTFSMSGMAVGICAVQLKQRTSTVPGTRWRRLPGLTIVSSEYWLQHVEVSSLLNPKGSWSAAIDTRLFLWQNSDSRSVSFFLIPITALCTFYEVLHSSLLYSLWRQQYHSDCSVSTGTTLTHACQC